MTFEYKYARPAVSVDIVAMGGVNGKREVLLIQRKQDPHADSWALPGGFLDIDETLEQAAARELKEETGLKIKTLRQLGAFSQVDRDPRTRVISIAFLAELVAGQTPVAADDAKDAGWFDLNELPKLAFDHAEMIKMAVEVC